MLNIFHKLSAKLSPISAKYDKKPISSSDQQHHNTTIKNAIILIVSSMVAIALFVTAALQSYWYSQELSQTALDNNEAVLVNIVTDEIFNGKLYVAEEEVEEKTTESVELTATSQRDEQSPLKFRSTYAELSNKNTNKIAIVVTNLGLNKSNTLLALNLRKEFTLGFTPYAMDLYNWISQATTKGFETLINIPMQPLDYPVNDPGPLSMLLNLSNNENLSRFSQIMLKSDKVVGFYSEQAEVFSQSKSSFSPIAADIAKNKHLFLYGNPSNASIMSEICKSVGLECQTNSLILDQELDEDAIKKQILALEGISYAKGFAVGFIRAYPLTINILKSWSDALNPDSLSLVPISVTLSSSNTIDHHLLPTQPIKEEDPKRVEQTTSKREPAKKDSKQAKQPEPTGASKDESSQPITDDKTEEPSDESKSDDVENKPEEKTAAAKEPAKALSKDKASKDVKQQKSAPKKQQVKDTKPKKKQPNTKMAAKSDQ